MYRLSSNLLIGFLRKTNFIVWRSAENGVFCASSQVNGFSTKAEPTSSGISVLGVEYERDGQSNVTPHILSYVGRSLHNKGKHPLSFIKQRIANFMYKKYVNSRGNAVFSVYDNLSPVVTTEQNFDSLLIPKHHVSWKKSDTYFINSKHLLRTHTSAHQRDLLLSGLNNFLVIGDVYRRDQIDSTHFPVFHQVEGVRVVTKDELFHLQPLGEKLTLFANCTRTSEKQESHTVETVKLLEEDLKDCLSSLVKDLFGEGTIYRWTDSYFPFTHPSWELEVLHNGDWLEVLGCGIMEQKILQNSGAGDRVGWAFGLGLERLAMMLYSIPDIRLFWSEDSGFLSQFSKADFGTPITYKPVSKYPQCINDISFWVPVNFHANDFYEIVRTVGGELVEQVYKVDEFFHPKQKRTSFCFRIVYRHMEKTLTQEEVNKIHANIGDIASQELGVEVRC